MDKDEARMRRFKKPSIWEKERIKQEFWASARRKCDDQFKAFMECEKANGLLVVVNCRNEHRAMNACLTKYTTPEMHEEFMMHAIQEKRRKEAAAERGQ